MPRIVRKIIEIDEARCNGCGLCVSACAEGAIAIRDGKARLISDVYCDGLGACLGDCPEGAITIRQREAEAFDEAAVHEHLAKTKGQPQPAETHGCTSGTPEPPPAVLRAACPGAAARSLNLSMLPGGPRFDAAPQAPVAGPESPSALSHWPVKLRLAPPNAPFFRDADLLLVADCVPFAYADFHQRLLQGRPVVIACPKLDDRQPAQEKLTAILTQSDVRRLTVVHIEVPCCNGLVRMAEAAVAASGRDIPLEDVTISVRGQKL